MILAHWIPWPYSEEDFSVTTSLFTIFLPLYKNGDEAQKIFAPSTIFIFTPYKNEIEMIEMW